MNPENCALAEQIVSKTYINQGSDALARRQKLIKSLLSSRRLPQTGWDDATIELFIQDCALMDSNNFVDNLGVGEREARVACDLVARRHFRLAHGIGRSGDVAAEQPKAAGSSLLAKLTNLLTADALRLAGLEDLGAVSVLPLATGMTVTVALLALKIKRPAGRYVIWSRIDQKTCSKAVVSAGLELVVVPTKLEGDQLVTDVEGVETEVRRLGPEAVLCVLTTTSCFAPRACDKVIEVAKLCRRLDVGHLINNAYGVQAKPICKAVCASWRRGRVDAVIQSTDKNFMVPVGGAVLCAGKGDSSLVEAVNKNYPGRASMSPLLDLLMTLLSLGADKWQRLLAQREAAYLHLQASLQALASKHGERLLHSPDNPISIGMTLRGLEAAGAAAAGLSPPADTVHSEEGAGHSPTSAPASESRASTPPVTDAGNKAVTFLGSMLFSRCVSGVRTIPRGVTQSVAGITFEGFGSSHHAYPTPYMTAAAALGTTIEEVDAFCARLDKALAESHKKLAKNAKRGKVMLEEDVGLTAPAEP